MLPIVIASELLTARRVLRVLRLARYTNKAVSVANKLDRALNKGAIAANDASSYELIHEPIHGEDIYIMLHGIALINMYRGAAGTAMNITPSELADIIAHPFSTPQMRAVAHDPVSKIYAYFDDLFRQLNESKHLRVSMTTLTKLKNTFKQGMDMRMLFIANSVHNDTNKALIMATSILGYDPGDAVFLAKAVRENTLGLNSKLEIASKEKNFLPQTLISIWIRSLDKHYVDSATNIVYEGEDFTMRLALSMLPVNFPIQRRVVKSVSTRPTLPGDIKRVTEQLEELYLGKRYTLVDPKEEEEADSALDKVMSAHTSTLNQLASNTKY